MMTLITYCIIAYAIGALACLLTNHSHWTDLFWWLLSPLVLPALLLIALWEVVKR